MHQEHDSDPQKCHYSTFHLARHIPDHWGEERNSSFSKSAREAARGHAITSRPTRTLKKNSGHPKDTSPRFIPHWFGRVSDMGWTIYSRFGGSLRGPNSIGFTGDWRVAGPRRNFLDCLYPAPTSVISTVFDGVILGIFPLEKCRLGVDKNLACMKLQRNEENMKRSCNKNFYRQITAR